MPVLMSMSVGEALAKSNSAVLADEIWNFKNPGEAIDQKDREYVSWRNSLPFFLRCAHEAGLDDVLVVFEMKTPISQKAIDVLLVGRSADLREERILVVELKQWSRIEEYYNANYVIVPEAGGRLRRRHPMHQLNLYRKNLDEHHSGIIRARAEGHVIRIGRLAYLHNFENRSALYTERYEKWGSCSMYFFARGDDERIRLTKVLRNWFANTRETGLLNIMEDYEAVMGDEGLAGLRKAYENESTYEMMKDQQKTTDYVVQQLERQQINPHRQMIVISGGPGTGKTIVGIRFVLEYVRIFNCGRNDNRVIFCLPKSQTVKAVFDSACSVEEEDENEYCCYLQEIGRNQNLVVVDEAHRITDLESTLDKVFEKGTKLLILLQDDHQLLRPGEQGTLEAFRQYAEGKGIEFSPSNISEKEELTLVDEKRCDEKLLKGVTKLFFDSSEEIGGPIEKITVFNRLSDLAAWKDGLAMESRTKYIFPYCWEWRSKYRDDIKTDITINDEGGNRFVKRWNPENTDEQVIWLNDNSDDRVACIYTSQGLDMDNVAFVWWDDLKWDEQCRIWRGNPSRLKDPAFRCEFDNDDQMWHQTKWDRIKRDDVRPYPGYSLSQEQMDLLIKNTYYVMLTRPRNCLGIWFHDEETKRHVLEVLGIEAVN